MTSTEFRLRGVMHRERGRVLTHEALLRHIWGPRHVDDTRPLRAHIANLRGKIASPHLRTIHGVGYRFDEPRPRGEVTPT